MKLKTDVVQEIAAGVFGAVLWGPEASLLGHLLDPQIPYVLRWGHSVGRYVWEPFELPIIDPAQPMEVLSRRAEFDFVLTTTRFLELLPSLGPKMQAVQLQTLPPDFLDLARIHGKQRFRLLADCGWHVLLDTPADDYGQVISPSRQVVEKAIEIHSSRTATPRAV